MNIAGISPKDGADLIKMLRLYQAGKLFPQPRTQPDERNLRETWYVKNMTGEEIPPFGCMRANGTVEEHNRIYIQVDKPSSEAVGDYEYLFNGRTAIAANQYGTAQSTQLVRAITQTSGPSVGQTIRPKAGTWELDDYDAEIPGQFHYVGEDAIQQCSIVLNSPVPGETLTVVTNVRVNSRNLQKKTRDIIVIFNGPESEWTTWHAGAECSPP